MTQPENNAAQLQPINGLYDTIINPDTGRSVSVYGKIGKKNNNEICEKKLREYGINIPTQINYTIN